MATNKQVHLVKYAEHEATEDCFQTNTAKLAPLKPGQLLIKVHYLSIDPYLRGLMNSEGSFAPAAKLGDVMPGGGIGEVVESKNSSFSVGDFVTGEFGWQQFAVCSGSGARGSDGSVLRKVDARKIKPSLYLGAAGMPGVTAWYGVNEILCVKSGETLVVSAASGAVGSVVAQLAKLKGCHVIGVAGGKDKCDYVVKELGADACIDYKQFKSGDKVAQIADAIKAAAPGGVDCYFENVGGDVGNAILRCMNLRGRVAVCGLIAGYEGHPNPITDPSLILAKRLVIQGMLVGDAGDELWATAIDELSQMLHDGKLKFRETVLDGLESAPSGLIGVLHGKNFGKMVVRLEGAPAEVGERRRA